MIRNNIPVVGLFLKEKSILLPDSVYKIIVQQVGVAVILNKILVSKTRQT